MDEEKDSDQDIKRRDFVTMLLTGLTLTTVGFSLWACGDDLTFPGRIPPTSTPSPTITSTPEEDDDDDDDDEEDL